MPRPTMPYPGAVYDPATDTVTLKDGHVVQLVFLSGREAAEQNMETKYIPGLAQLRLRAAQDKDVASPLRPTPDAA